MVQWVQKEWLSLTEQCPVVLTLPGHRWHWGLTGSGDAACGTPEGPRPSPSCAVTGSQMHLCDPVEGESVKKNVIS